MNDRFSDGQAEQLEEIIQRVVSAIVQKEVSDQLNEKIPLYLKPLREEIQEFRKEAREDADALNGVVMQNTEDIELLKRKVGLPVAA